VRPRENGRRGDRVRGLARTAWQVHPRLVHGEKRRELDAQGEPAAERPVAREAEGRVFREPLGARRGRLAVGGAHAPVLREGVFTF